MAHHMVLYDPFISHQRGVVERQKRSTSNAIDAFREAVGTK